MYPWSRGIDLDMGMYAAAPKSLSVLNGQHCDRRLQRVQFAYP
jgi:hypothetical protein